MIFDNIQNLRLAKVSNKSIQTIQNDYAGLTH
jgi:hypothetical protein